MKRDRPMDWYVGRIVRLARDVRMWGGRVYRRGRAFRVSSHWRGHLNLVAPDKKIMKFGGDEACIRQADFADVRLARKNETGFCRVCGCTDEDGCSPDGAGISCRWTDYARTLCSRCV